MSEEADKVQKAIEAGRLKFTPRALESIASMAPGNPDFTVTAVRLPASFAVEWETASAGFGEVRFYVTDGVLRCDNEAMSKEFVKAVLSALVDAARFDY